MDLEFDYCMACDKLVEKSAIVFFDPKTKIMLCRDHEALIEEYKQKTRIPTKEKSLKHKRNQL